MSAIQHEYTLNPVTALDFYRLPNGLLLLLVGEGQYLKVFEAGTSKLLAICKVFAAQIVHGVTVRETISGESFQDDDLKVVIWGGRSFMTLDNHQVQAIVSREIGSLIHLETCAEDWILNGSISPLSTFKGCIFITAHNALLRVQFNRGSEKPRVETLLAASQAILYSAHVVWDSHVSFLAACGSVFGEITVLEWKDEKCSLLYTFTGHEGSIFGVQISPRLIGPDGKSMRLLASCSDDRTIRLWDLGSDETVREYPIALQDETSLRETGFGDNLKDHQRELSDKRSLASTMGHTSRIWGVRFLLSDVTGLRNSPLVNVLSFGEDSTSQQWSLESWTKTADQHALDGTSYATSSPPATLNHLDTFAYHTGKHIWSSAILLGNDGLSYLATGGADSKVSMYKISARDLRNGSDPKEPAGQSWTLEELVENIPIHEQYQVKEEPLVLQEAVTDEPPPTEEVETAVTKKKKKPKPPPKPPKDAMNRYSFVTSDQLIATTSFGRILLGSVKEPLSWQELYLPGERNLDLRSYSLITGVPHKGVAFLAGFNGKIYIYKASHNIVEVAQVTGKVATLLHLSDSDENLRLLVTTLGGSEATILTVDVKGETSVLRDTSIVSLPQSFIVTSACDVDENLVLGSKSAVVAVYKLSVSTEPFETLRTQLGANSDAVTSILHIPADSVDKSYFLATSRNGSYSIFSLSRVRNSGSLEGVSNLSLLHHAIPPFVSIENAWFDGSDLILYGFRSKNFVVWNETKQCEILSVNCGGSHRSYAYSPREAAGGAGDFVYTKASRLYIHSQSSPSHIIIKPGGHGREIKTCATSPNGGGSKWFATGSEDTTIRIWSYSPDLNNTLNSSFECLSVIQKHVSGLQHVQFGEMGDEEPFSYFFSASGNEEFHIWRISSIPSFGLGVVLESTLTDFSEDRDLRIMSFDAQREWFRGLRRADAPPPDPEFHIMLAYSDSTMKRFSYSKGNGWNRVMQGRYTAACLTQIESLQGAPFNTFVTSSTDGHLALWSLPSLPVPVPAYTPPQNLPPSLDIALFRTRLHQSSISALAIMHLGEICLLATGGDDNAIVLTSLHGKTGTILSRTRIPNAHAAAITGISWIEDITGGPEQGRWERFWSIGGDQKVRRWTVEMKQEGWCLGSSFDVTRKIEMVVQGDIMGEKGGRVVGTSVADAAGLVGFRTGWDGYKVLAFGTGLEIFGCSDGYPGMF